MKKIFSILATLFLFVTVTSAQWTSNATINTNTKSTLEVYFAGTADSLGGTYATTYSNLFSLEDFDGVNLATYSYVLGAPAGSPKLAITLVGSNNTTTAASMIALKSLADSATTTTETFGSIDLTAMHCKYYRLKIASVTTGRANPTFKVWITVPKRDF